ncbi:MAG: dTDP-4-dehydrorhamnose reductase [Desulfobacterales bacterium]|nr:dTDP-4-dehydrorhamnose reductase [Desulfobacterales bacterium]
MKILVTGAQGQLGSEILMQGKDYPFHIRGFGSSRLDITQPSQVKESIDSVKPDLVVNAAGYTRVDQAEDEPERAFAVNSTGPANLAGCCHLARIPLIQISTDYVFDGTKTTPYLEDDVVSPLSVYGQSQARGEDRVRSALREHIIIRTSWLYGFYGKNFVKTMLQIGREREVVSVVADQFGSPTSAADLAECILRIARRISEGAPVAWGTYHYCGEGVTTWHMFAETLFNLAIQYRPLKIRRIIPISTADYPAKARRPPYSALDSTRIQNNFGITPKPWPESLKTLLDRMMRESS